MAKGLHLPIKNKIRQIIFKHVYWNMQQILGERLQDHWSSGLCYRMLFRPSFGVNFSFKKILTWTMCHFNTSRVIRNPGFYLCENKGAVQLCSNCTAEQRLCFRYTDSTIPLLPKSEISGF